MKIKTLLISGAAAAAVAGGGIFAARRIMISNKTPVQVMPVANADLGLLYASWGMDSMDDGMSGSIISKDTQTVDLSIGDGKTLKSVNVKEGDQVKTGDVLMEYDVQKQELEREKDDLSLQMAELVLRTQESELDAMRSKNPSLYADLETEERTASADTGAVLIEEPESDLPLETADGLSGPASSGTGSNGAAKGQTLALTAAKDRILPGSDTWLEDPNADILYDLLLEDAMGSYLLDGFQTSAERETVEDLLLDPLDEEGETEDADLFTEDQLLEDGTSTGLLSEGLSGLFESAAYSGTLSDALDDAALLMDADENAQDLSVDETTGNVLEDEAENENRDEITGGAEPANEVLEDGEAQTDVELEEDGILEPDDGIDPAEYEDDVLIDLDVDEEPIDIDNEIEEDTDPAEDTSEAADAPDIDISDADLDIAGDLEADDEKVPSSVSAEGDGSSGETARSTDLSASGAQIQSSLKTFLALVNLLTRQYTAGAAELRLDDLEQAGALYRGFLSREETTKPFLDAMGNQRSVTIYIPSTQTLRALREMEQMYSDFSASDTLLALHQACANYLYYRFVYCMEHLKTELGGNLNGLTVEQVRANEASVTAAVNAYYELYFFRRYLKESVPKLAEKSSLYLPLSDIYLGELKSGMLSYVLGQGEAVSDGQFEAYPVLGYGYKGDLSILVDLYRGDTVLEEGTEALSEPETMTEDGDFGDGDGNDGESAQDLRDEFFEKLQAVRSQRLTVREAALKLKQDNEAIEKATVRASLDGVVRSAGTLEEGTSSSDGFIVVAGAKGMYLVGNINELKRDTVQIGDVITGSSEETGQSFTAVVTEVLDYPTTSEENDEFYFYDYSMDVTNSNVSNYRFYAYIEDADGLEEGYATMKFEKDASSENGIMLEEYFVREEDNGKKYVYVRGENGTIQKQYVSTQPASSMFGSSVMVTGGLTYEDLIAFPADSIKEGDPTKEVDFLEDSYY